jgi:hypothetical protein
VASDFVLKYWRHCRFDWLVAVLFPEAIQHMEPRGSEGAGRTSKPTEVIGGATALDQFLLPEIPAKLAHIVQTKRPAKLLSCGLFEERRRLQQVARHQKPELPFGESPQQLRVTMQKGAEIDGGGPVHEVQEHMGAAIAGDADG